MTKRREKSNVTPDGRYFVVRGRLWRCANPGLAEEVREALVRELMAARRAKGTAMRAGNAAAREAARMRVDAAKHALGERGAVWWTDGEKDWNRFLVKNTPYAEWFLGVEDDGGYWFTRDQGVVVPSSSSFK